MKVTVELQVLNELGVHARPATEFVRCALHYRTTTVRVLKGDQTFVASSILEILSAELDHGCVFILEADGPDAETVAEAFAALLRRFRDDEEGERRR